jgi:hypothetical protein
MEPNNNASRIRGISVSASRSDTSAIGVLQCETVRRPNHIRPVKVMRAGNLTSLL